jgi:hypothetical protein
MKSERRHLMKRQTLVTQWWIPCVLILALLLGGGLVGCTSSPPAPQTDPPGPEISVGAGETVAIRASAEGATKYEWTLAGDGEISATEGATVLYTAPDAPGGMAVLEVTAINEGGASSPTSFVINVACSRAAEGEGTVSPAVAISSITFVVNDGVEQVVRGSGTLSASPGDEVRVAEVTICVGSFEGGGGVVYVEFDPVEHDQTDPEGRIVADEVKGTGAAGVVSGFTAIPGPDHTWTIGENWRHISVVTVHYPAGGGTENPACEGGICEVDDRVIVGW